jgi:hypothetical protein
MSSTLERLRRIDASMQQAIEMVDSMKRPDLISRQAVLDLILDCKPSHPEGNYWDRMKEGVEKL